MPLSMRPQRRRPWTTSLSLGWALWQELVTLWGEDLTPDHDEDDDDDSGRWRSRIRRLRPGGDVLDGSRVLFREDDELDVLATDDEGEEDIVSLPPGELEPGMMVASCPALDAGLYSNSALDAGLCSNSDDRPRRAHRSGAADARAAIPAPPCRQLSSATVSRRSPRLRGRKKFSVWDWLADGAKPGSKRAFEALLEASADEEAWRARSLIWEYLSHKRGVHRYIGRLMRRAIGESLCDDGDRTHFERSKMSCTVVTSKICRPGRVARGPARRRA
jgi:hypothetical protein